MPRRRRLAAIRGDQPQRRLSDGEGDARRATVYDFKTNRMRPKETPEEFEMRMQETYAGQLAAYRTAVSVLAGIPPERVAARLLLVGASV